MLLPIGLVSPFLSSTGRINKPIQINITHREVAIGGFFFINDVDKKRLL